MTVVSKITANGSTTSSSGVYVAQTNNVITVYNIATINGTAYGIYSVGNITFNNTNITGNVTDPNGAIYTTGNISDNITIAFGANVSSANGWAFKDNDSYINGSVTNNCFVYSGAGYGIAAVVNITNNGTVVANGNSNYGIVTTVFASNITNSGNVSTDGCATADIRAFGANSTIINTATGIISTKGSAGMGYAYDIYTTADNANITNCGSIIIANANVSCGIFATTGSNVTINNHGSISAIGATGYPTGIVATGANATLNEYGNVSSAVYHAIYIGGAKSTIDFRLNTSSVISSGSSAYNAVYLTGAGSVMKVCSIGNITAAAHAINAATVNITFFDNAMLNG